ncbi:hypothetical protein NLG97_g9975 [Lecanicillium saksenae]|uniref:Uncharacterized protein n=1 Tax=Lecanicillium saksenae TaxID=468837 RepID=A0ACC1QF00_9HYPO|nr:hypothetical protein NLG97_g9975 [Lecanicillium saksenae]
MGADSGGPVRGGKMGVMGRLQGTYRGQRTKSEAAEALNPAEETPQQLATRWRVADHAVILPPTARLWGCLSPPSLPGSFSLAQPATRNPQPTNLQPDPIPFPTTCSRRLLVLPSLSSLHLHTSRAVLFFFSSSSSSTTTISTVAANHYHDKRTSPGFYATLTTLLPPHPRQPAVTNDVDMAPTAVDVKNEPTAADLAALTAEFDGTLRFYLNGTKVVLDDIDPEVTVLEYLRGIGLTGTKLGCGEGGCGACTIVVSQFNPTTNQIYHASVNACLAPLVSLDGKHVITIEGIGNTKRPHPTQERVAMGNGSQCGFCTPGIGHELVRAAAQHDAPTEHEVEEVFGPVCVVGKFTTESEALQLCNDSKYGLNAAVFTSSIGRALRFADGLESGRVSVNTATAHTMGLPFGGVKESGQGRECGREGIISWLELKTIFLDASE